MPRCAVRDLLAALVLLTFAVAATPTSAQTFSVLHTFTGGADGSLPNAGMIMNPAGNLYGTTLAGGTGSCVGGPVGVPGCGTIFQLKKHNTSWIFNPLYSLHGGMDGNFPLQSLTLGPNGTYYGTTPAGGEGSCGVGGGCGTVFNAGPDPSPPRTPLLKFRESVFYRFTGGSDGAGPWSTVIFDQAGNIYGTTTGGGAHNAGTVFKLSPTDGGNYTETVLYSFAGDDDGASPFDGLISDAAGNLYGTTAYGGGGVGTVFELSPTGGGNYTEKELYPPLACGLGGGGVFYAGVAMDSAGNLYGNTSRGGASGAGTVYELTPNGSNWNCTVLYSVPGSYHDNTLDRVTLDSSGNLYETLRSGGAFGLGQVLELVRSGSNWTFVDLYDFTGGSDGEYPVGGVVLDASGNLYGTAEMGAGAGCGGGGCGVVWEITR